MRRVVHRRREEEPEERRRLDGLANPGHVTSPASWHYCIVGLLLFSAPFSLVSLWYHPELVPATPCKDFKWLISRGAIALDKGCPEKSSTGSQNSDPFPRHIEANSHLGDDLDSVLDVQRPRASPSSYTRTGISPPLIGGEVQDRSTTLH
ncbi:hypothetical protein BO94DRAFT_389295 [Aspergillus sclerotioniger CBS 115572]|uniref:Uncharacterized protein n=1 Tax=Aspergillus sclerotioniger CBS 115572 TaxID=1450535 RepID=A0A317X2Z2_9EURO|nr:hypothetical protein BO94DRAFT_389295 [Aspergillus sclerotioniger CBS 115572]PWY91358.1 hypothetical protein BO94DRAFT_389295 [Aspergillus sclerotioniger CBS 115572]